MTTFANDCQSGNGTEFDFEGLTGHFAYTCNAIAVGMSESLVGSSTTNRFSDCVNNCANRPCDTVSWNIVTGLYSQYDGAPPSSSTNYGYDYAVIIIDSI